MGTGLLAVHILKGSPRARDSTQGGKEKDHSLAEPTEADMIFLELKRRNIGIIVAHD
jgi:hypothetical protein